MRSRISAVTCWGEKRPSRVKERVWQVGSAGDIERVDGNSPSLMGWAGLEGTFLVLLLQPELNRYSLQAPGRWEVVNPTKGECCIPAWRVSGAELGTDALHPGSQDCAEGNPCLQMGGWKPGALAPSPRLPLP